MDMDPTTESEFEIIVEAGDSDGESGAGVKRKRRVAPCDNCRYVSIALTPSGNMLTLVHRETSQV